jgi:hypothetical protein
MPKMPRKLREWCARPHSAGIGPGEAAFLAAVYRAHSIKVGFGFMQQVCEWVWQEECPHGPEGTWGPEYFGKEIDRLEAENKELKRRLGDPIE